MQMLHKYANYGSISDLSAYLSGPYWRIMSVCGALPWWFVLRICSDLVPFVIKKCYARLCLSCAHEQSTICSESRFLLFLVHNGEIVRRMRGY